MGPRFGAGPLKGVGSTSGWLAPPACHDAESLHATWWYDWRESPHLIRRGTASCEPTSTYVPMIWSSSHMNFSAVDLRAEALLGFNEPDKAGHANMTVDEAVAAWPALYDFSRRHGMRLGSPAPAGETADQQQGWLHRFLRRVGCSPPVDRSTCQLDFIALHYYLSCDVADLVDFLSGWAAAYDLPLWLTETSCWHGDAASNAAYLGAIAKALHGTPPAVPALERYAWYATRTSGNGYEHTALNAGADGNLTALGSMYAAIGGAPPHTRLGVDAATHPLEGGRSSYAHQHPQNRSSAHRPHEHPYDGPLPPDPPTSSDTADRRSCGLPCIASAAWRHPPTPSAGLLLGATGLVLAAVCVAAYLAASCSASPRAAPAKVRPWPYGPQSLRQTRAAARRGAVKVCGEEDAAKDKA